MRTIFTGYAPAEGSAHVHQALRQLLPWHWWSWRSDKGSKQVEAWLKAYFNNTHAITVDSGRAALQLTLEALKLKKGDEVLVQAYTCLVVVNAIRWAGGTPVFVDITPDFTMDPMVAAAKVTPRTRALIIQHTFGLAADSNALQAVAAKHKLFTIEDCAHALGVRTTSGELLGTQSDAAILSFGSDKVISASRGGAVITPHKHIAKAITKRVNALPVMPISYLLPHLLRVVWFAIGKSTYHLGIGKWFMAVMAKLGLSSRMIYPSEKKGLSMKPFPAKWPNALAALVWPQLQALDRVQARRLVQTKRYVAEITNPALQIVPNAAQYPLVRFPALVSDPKAWHSAAMAAGIMLGDWYSTVVAPYASGAVDGYMPGSCPMAEQLTKTTINLPTGPWLTPAEQGRVISFINSTQL